MTNLSQAFLMIWNFRIPNYWELNFNIGYLYFIIEVLEFLVNFNFSWLNSSFADIFIDLIYNFFIILRLSDLNSIMIIEPKWSLRPGDWDLSAFNIIPILVGAIPSNSMLVSLAFSKLANFFLKSGEKIYIISI